MNDFPDTAIDYTLHCMYYIYLYIYIMYTVEKFYLNC